MFEYMTVQEATGLLCESCYCNNCFVCGMYCCKHSYAE